MGFNIRRAYLGSKNDIRLSPSFQYAVSDGKIPVLFTGSIDKAFDSSTLRTDLECLNIYPRWCGDGILESNNGEQCDPNDPKQT